jgi:tetratricopeptide (TPR) repeat protein
VSEAQETATVGPKASPTEAQGAWPAGHVVAERYEVRAFLGRGGHSLVYRVYDRDVGDEIALKVLHPGRDPERTLSRLGREVAIAREASSSHLVRVFHLEQSGGDAYLTMELMEGGSLRRRLEAGPLPIPESVRIAEAVLQGLAALHACGAVHRDVTPGNILFSGRGEVKLGDFGLVRRPERDETALTARDAILGTEGYRSPEQALGKKVGPQSDLYALGVVLFEMLAGRLPHEAGGSEFERCLSVLDRAPDVRPFRPEVPSWLARVVARLLEVRLADRYREAEDVLRDLTDEKSPRRVRLRRWLLRAAVALFLLLPQAGIILQPAPGASFSHLVPLEGEGIAAVGTRGEELWKLRGVDQENSTKWVLARITPGGPRLLALVPTRPGQWSPEDVSTLTFYDPATGKVERRIKLPSAAGSFPNDPPRFSIASVKTVDLFHDGTDEIIVNYRHVPEAPSYAVLYAPRLNQARVVYYAYGGQEFEGAADLDGDGIPELLFAGIDNGWNWVNVVAAVKIDPKSLKEGDSLTTPTAPDAMTESSQERLLLWYATVPRGLLEDFHRLAIDEKRREITVRYLSGKTWTLGFDGFPPGAPRADIAERQEARRATYEHLREAERLRKAGQLDLAMSEARAAEDSAKRAQEIWLAEYAERLQAKILVAQGKILDAEALFTSLVGRAEDAPEVAYDAGVAFHLAGDLRRAVMWYEKGIGRDSAIGAGKSKHEFLKGEVLALVEEKRYEEALAAAERFGETYPTLQDQLWLFREYIRWRAGERPEANPGRVRPNATDLSRYWELEFEFADGREPKELLSRVDRFLAERPETKTEARSLRAELLDRLGRTKEAAQVAQAALELARVEAPRSIIARGHLSLLEERARRLGSEFRPTLEDSSKAP